MSDISDDLREKTARIVAEGDRLLASNEFPTPTDCSAACASCLSAVARGNVDKIDHEFGFSSREDICMLEARNILAEKHNLIIN